jgi:hypothetical protein
MKCPIEKCSRSEDCEILDIIKKIPKSFKDCSYSKTEEQSQKIKNKSSKNL